MLLLCEALEQLKWADKLGNSTSNRDCVESQRQLAAFAENTTHMLTDCNAYVADCRTQSEN